MKREREREILILRIKCCTSSMNDDNDDDKITGSFRGTTLSGVAEAERKSSTKSGRTWVTPFRPEGGVARGESLAV
jgi:hypothetical protein